MKVCSECHRINPDDVDKCLECGQSEFIELVDPPFYDSIEEYWNKESNNETC